MVTCQCGVMDVRGTSGGELRDGFRFRGGHAALDFAATLARRLKADPRELLAAPEDLARWLVAAGMAESPPKVSNADLVAARALREAVYALAEAQIHGRLPAGQDVATLNRLADGPAAVPWLDDEGSAHRHANARFWRGRRCCCSAVRTARASASARRGAAHCCSSTCRAPATGAGARCKVAETRPRWRSSGAAGVAAADARSSALALRRS